MYLTVMYMYLDICNKCYIIMVVVLCHEAKIVSRVEHPFRLLRVCILLIIPICAKSTSFGIVVVVLRNGTDPQSNGLWLRPWSVFGTSVTNHHSCLDDWLIQYSLSNVLPQLFD